MTYYTCPVCDFAELEEDPFLRNHNICPCCATQFGYHDSNRTHAMLREAWIAAGRPWYYPVDPLPYQCPVCYFDGMHYPPSDYNICPCCGTEFDLDDVYVTHAELRTRWIEGGAAWWSRYTPAPKGWNVQKQLGGLP